jgi:hypothetical protein
MSRSQTQTDSVSQAPIARASGLLAERVGKFALLPVSDSGKWSYTAKGSVDFLSETTLRLDGAGGQTCTILPQAMFFVDLAA